MRRIFLLLLAFVACALLVQQARAQIQVGDAVVTCYGGAPTDFVFGYIRVQNANVQPVNTNWAAPMYHGSTWTRSRMGTVFGITLDNNGNSYVTATSCYGGAISGSGGTPGTIYRIDAITDAVTNWATLPNTGPALGNICFDPDHSGGLFFVTNMEDGKIYRLSMAGITLSTYDPFTPDPGTAGFAPRGERLWGIGYYKGRVYFSVWKEDCGFPNPNVSNEIYSVALDASGNFIGAPVLEITVPPLTGQKHSNPVSDIEFTDNASPVRMLLAERTMLSDMGTNAHASRVLEYIAGAGWTPSPSNFSIGTGNISSSCGYQTTPVVANSSGGTDYGYRAYDPATGLTTFCNDAVWAMGDGLHFFNPDLIYGLQRLPATGGSIANSVLIDLDGNLTTSQKTLLGDVDVYQQCVPTQPPDPCKQKSYQISFAGQQEFCCCWNLTINNSLANFWTNIRLDALTPGVTIANVISPSGWTTTLTPTSAIWTHGSGFVPVGASGPFRFCINPGSTTPQVMQLTWTGPNGKVCRDTIKLDCHPNQTKGECPCGSLLVKTLTCKETATGVPIYNFTFQIQNNTTGTMGNATINVISPVSGVTITPGSFSFPAVPPGGTTGLLNATISGGAPGSQVCFRITICDPKNTACCSFTACITLPQCKDCCDSLKISFKPPTITYNTLGQVFFNTAITSNPNLLRRFSATIVSATQQKICLFPSPATPVLAPIGAASFITAPLLPGPSITTNEAVWGVNPSGSTVVGAPFGLTLNFPPPPSGLLCKDIITFCIRFTYTDVNCRTCDSLVCYQLTRKKPWWHTPFPADQIPFEPGRKDDGDDKEKDRSTLSADPEPNPVRIIMENENVGKLVMTSPPLLDADAEDAISIVSISLEPAVGTDLLRFYDEQSGGSTEIIDRMGTLQLRPPFGPGEERTFTVEYDNYAGARSFANYLKLVYYRASNPEVLYEDGIIVYARVPNKGEAQDELTRDDQAQLQNVRTYALRFLNSNATQDYTCRVEISVDAASGDDIIATGPSLDRLNVGLRAYRTKDDEPYLHIASPEELGATLGLILPKEEVRPIFVTVCGGDDASVVFNYTTYNENGDVVSQGSFTADNPLAPGPAGVDEQGRALIDVTALECYPNPATHGTTFRFRLPSYQPEVWLVITDQLGNEVARLAEGTAMAAGEHTIDFNGSALANGTYFYTLRTGSFTQTRKMQIVR